MILVIFATLDTIVIDWKVSFAAYATYTDEKKVPPPYEDNDSWRKERNVSNRIAAEGFRRCYCISHSMRWRGYGEFKFLAVEHSAIAGIRSNFQYKRLLTRPIRSTVGDTRHEDITTKEVERFG